jgi:3-oxoacyl-[acyl-carrier protein] reductase
LQNDIDVFTHWRNGENEPGILLEELRGAGIRVEAMELDLSLPGSPERLLNEVAERLGPPSILVNNAACSTGDGYEALDAPTLGTHYAVSLWATALLSVVFARRFVGETGGRIVNLTSGQSLGPMPGELAYVATKGAIEAFTRTLAAEVGHKGIIVNAVNPGPTNHGLDDLPVEAGTLGQIFRRQGRRARGRGAASGVPGKR